MSDFTKRMSLAWRALTGRKTVATMFNDVGWTTLTPTYYSTNYESLVKHGYRKNELIYACISKKANASSQIAMTVRRNADAEPDENHPLKLLIQQPNPYMSEFDFWSAVIIFQQLAGRALFEKERSKAGQVVRLWPLRPDWTTPVPQGNLIVAYEFRVPGKTPVTLDAADIVDFSLLDPFLQFDGWPPAAVAARIGDVDNATTDHIKNIWEHGGIPAGLIKSTQRLVKEQVDVIQSQFLERYGGSANWLKPMVLDTDAEYQKVGFSFQELGFETLDARSEARICMVMDVPPILVGAKVGLDRATYANYGEARRAWWQDSLIPMYTSFLDVLQNQLGNEFGDPLIEFDFNAVPALQEERNSRWQRATVAWNAGAITNNEFRAEVGLPERPEGDVFKTAPVEILGTEEETDEETDGEAPKARPLRVIHMDIESVAGTSKAAEAPDAKKRRKHEKLMTEAMGEYFASQVKRIKKELANAE